MPEHILTQRTPRVLAAPNSFKGSLTATEAAQAIRSGVHRVLPDATCLVQPVADGGDGSVAAFLAAGFTPVDVDVHGPLGEPVRATIAVHADLAVVELASCCGLALLPPGANDPTGATTTGLGEAVLAALDRGVRRLVVCLGGSASSDGGTGALVALGARITDDDGREVAPNGAGLARIAHLDLAGLDPRLAVVRMTLAVDVRSPLAGPEGAAAVFAPQKGASPDEVVRLDSGLRAWGHVLAEVTGRDVADLPGAGAAGGTAAGLMAVLGADVQPGADIILDLVRLDAQLADVDVVITGEGRIDEQSALGKAVGTVAQRSRAAGVPVLAVAGSLALDPDALRRLGIEAWADCRSRARDDADAFARADALLADAAADALRQWLAKPVAP